MGHRSASGGVGHGEPPGEGKPSTEQGTVCLTVTQ